MSLSNDEIQKFLNDSIISYQKQIEIERNEFQKEKENLLNEIEKKNIEIKILLNKNNNKNEEINEFEN